MEKDTLKWVVIGGIALVIVYIEWQMYNGVVGSINDILKLPSEIPAAIDSLVKGTATELGNNPVSLAVENYTIKNSVSNAVASTPALTAYQNASVIDITQGQNVDIASLNQTAPTLIVVPNSSVGSYYPLPPAFNPITNPNLNTSILGGVLNQFDETKGYQGQGWYEDYQTKTQAFVTDEATFNQFKTGLTQGYGWGYVAPPSVTTSWFPKLW